jgi:hypothetical protein
MPLAREAVAEACANQRQRRTGERICHGEKRPSKLDSMFFDVASQIAACNRENRSMMSPFDNQL